MSAARRVLVSVAAVVWVMAAVVGVMAAVVGVMSAVGRMLVSVAGVVGVMPALVMAVWPGGHALLGHGLAPSGPGAARAGCRLDSGPPGLHIMCI
jgi:hypothetical protein